MEDGSSLFPGGSGIAPVRVEIGWDWSAEALTQGLLPRRGEEIDARVRNLASSSVKHCNISLQSSFSIVMLAQRCDFPGERPDEDEGAARRSWDETVVLLVRDAPLPGQASIHVMRMSPWRLSGNSPENLRSATETLCSTRMSYKPFYQPLDFQAATFAS